MASRNIATEFVYGIKLDTKGLDKDLKDAQKKVNDAFSKATTSSGGGFFAGKNSGDAYRKDYLGRFSAGANYQHEMLNAVQEIANDVAIIAYKAGVSESDILNFQKSRIMDFELPDDGQKDAAEAPKTFASNLTKAWDKIFPHLKKSGVLLGAWVMLLKKSYDAADKLLDVMSEASNEFVSASSAFVDATTKSTMAQFGVSAVQAQGINIAKEKLGISTSDLATLTQGQRDAFSRLMQIYQEGIESIDTDKLEAYNANIQRYEMIKAEFDIKREVAITKLFANASGIDRLIDSFGKFLDSVISILESPAAQSAMDMFIGFLSGIVDWISSAVNLVSKIPGFSGSSNTTNNTTTTNYNYYGSRTSNFSQYTTAAELQRVQM